MTITWKNLTVILFILGTLSTYIVRFEASAKDVQKNKNNIRSLIKGVKTLVYFQCKDKIESAQGNEDKLKEAIKRCKPFDIKLELPSS